MAVEQNERGSRNILGMLRSAPSAALYTVSTILSQMFSFITIPVMSAYVTPAEYAHYDFAMSVIEVFLLVAALGMVPQLVRFASTATTKEEADTVARELLGTAIVAFFFFAALFQIAAFYVFEGLSIQVGAVAFRVFLLFAAAIAAFDLYFMWLRIQDRAWLFLVLSFLKTGIGAVALVITLSSGGTTSEWMIVWATFCLFVSAAQCYVMYLEVGVSFRFSRFVQIAQYGAPIVVSALAMYALGNANRLLLPGNASEQEIAHFALAARLAIIVHVIFMPFELWWQPRRIGLLRTREGVAESAEYWALGVGVLLLGSAATALAAPVFIEIAVPAEYGGATGFIAALVIAMTLHKLVSLCDVGAYARSNGYWVLTIDCIGAAVAFVGYFVLVPRYGAAGAIPAMYLGNLTRLGLNLATGSKIAPIRYPWARAALAAVAAAFIVWLAPGADNLGLHILWGGGAGLGLVAFFAWIGLFRPVEPAALKVLERYWRVRKS